MRAILFDLVVMWIWVESVDVLAQKGPAKRESGARLAEHTIAALIPLLQNTTGGAPFTNVD